MNAIPIRLAVEDELSEWTARRALSERPVDYSISAVYARGGVGYLRKQARAFNNAAMSSIILLSLRFRRTPYRGPAHRPKPLAVNRSQIELFSYACFSYIDLPSKNFRTYIGREAAAF